MRSPTKLLWCLPFYLATFATTQIQPPVLIDTAPATYDRFPAAWYPANNDQTYTLPIVKDLPYTATVVLTDQYESEGKIITHRTSTLRARDSSGRLHEETENGSRTEGGKIIPTRTITVTDPVSHCNFRWIEPAITPEKPIALVNCMPRTIRYINQNVWSDVLKSFLVTEPKEQHSPNGSSLLSEPLGRKTFGDVEAEGLRTTATNANPQTNIATKRVTETWFSPEINEIVQLTFNDLPDSINVHNNQTPYLQLTNIQRTEPSPTLFYPPPDFEIQPRDFK